MSIAEVVKLAMSSPITEKIDRYRNSLKFLKVSERPGATELESKLLYLASLRIFITGASFFVFFLCGLTATCLILSLQSLNDYLAGLDIPIWAWPWNYSEELFLKNNLVNGQQLFENRDVYISMCSLFSIWWSAWAILNLVVGSLISGWLDKIGRIVALFAVSLIMIVAASQHLLLTTSIEPSILDPVWLVLAKKFTLIAVCYLTLTLLLASILGTIKGKTVYRSHRARI